MNAKQLREGDPFQIVQNGKVYLFIGITVNGLMIYQDSQGRFYDRKNLNVYRLVPIGVLARGGFKS